MKRLDRVDKKRNAAKLHRIIQACMAEEDFKITFGLLLDYKNKGYIFNTDYTTLSKELNDRLETLIIEGVIPESQH